MSPCELARVCITALASSCSINPLPLSHLTQEMCKNSGSVTTLKHYTLMFVCVNGCETLIYHQIPKSPDLQITLEGEDAFTFPQVFSDWKFNADQCQGGWTSLANMSPIRYIWNLFSAKATCVRKGRAKLYNSRPADWNMFLVSAGFLRSEGLAFRKLAQYGVSQSKVVSSGCRQAPGAVEKVTLEGLQGFLRLQM